MANEKPTSKPSIFKTSGDFLNRYCIECTHQVYWECILSFDNDFLCCYCKEKRGWVYVQRNLTFH